MDHMDHVTLVIATKLCKFIKKLITRKDFLVRDRLS